MAGISLSLGLEESYFAECYTYDPLINSFVCNGGDRLDRLTGGRYLSAPHHVRNLSGRNRLSLAFFFDPNYFNAEVRPLMDAIGNDHKEDRWDGPSVHEFRGTYGGYLISKVSKVFPE